MRTSTATTGKYSWACHVCCLLDGAPANTRQPPCPTALAPTCCPACGHKFRFVPAICAGKIIYLHLKCKMRRQTIVLWPKRRDVNVFYWRLNSQFNAPFKAGDTLFFQPEPIHQSPECAQQARHLQTKKRNWNATQLALHWPQNQRSWLKADGNKWGENVDQKVFPS